MKKTSLKPRNDGQWTEARFKSFVMSALRSASIRWPPKYQTLNEACVGRQVNPSSGKLAKFYKCNLCKQIFTAKNIQVNHKIPVIPLSGFDSWDNTVNRMFCEKQHLEVLCIPCHKTITQQENTERKKNVR